MTVSVARLQSYLREVARQHYDAMTVPSFTLFFHPTDPLPFFNYAIPDGPVDGDQSKALRRVRALFVERDRRPRFEFVEEISPGLPDSLCAAGFEEESRQPLMVCSRATQHPASPFDGLTVVRLTAGASALDVKDLLTAQRRGFDPADFHPVTEADVHDLREKLTRAGIAFLARINGEAAGAAMTSEPLDGLCELVGLATLEPFRGRGVGTALAGASARAALERGLQAVLLTASDDRAARMYGRVGFIRRSTMLSWSDPRPIEGSFSYAPDTASR